MKKLNAFTPTNIVQRLKQIDKLQNSIRDFLSIPSQDIQFWAVIKKQQLTLFTDSTFFATQIQYQQKAICDYVNNVHKLNLNAINTKLIASQIASPSSKKNTKSLSEDTVKSILTYADQVEDSELKQTLKLLSTSKIKD
jgi:hypothetical protein